MVLGIHRASVCVVAEAAARLPSLSNLSSGAFILGQELHLLKSQFPHFAGGENVRLWVFLLW